jgi:hypothetical protein
MKQAAIGIRAHSGWGAVVVIAGSPTTIEAIDRRRIAITGPNIAEAIQPYHFAQGQTLSDAEAFLSDCAAISVRLALQGLGEVVDELRRREYVPVGCAIVLASGRPLPPLSQILESHPLIHTAEGEFFRQAFWKACDRLEIPVTGIRERDLDARAEAILGNRTTQFRDKIAALGKSVGPPWTADQKIASLAAWLVL